MANPYANYYDDLIESLKELTNALNKLKYDELSRKYSSIQDRPKSKPILLNKQYNYNIRNQLRCKRTIKQGVNFRNK